MDDFELTQLVQRLSATTMFSGLPKEQLLGLLKGKSRRKARAGSWLADTDSGLKSHLILLTGELEATRGWTSEEGRGGSYTWRVNIDPQGPGFSLLSAASSGIRVQALTEADYLLIDGEELDELLAWGDLGENQILMQHRKVFHKVPLENVQEAFRRMTERPVAAGDIIVTQGDPGDSYYIILSGEAEVWVKDPITDEVGCVAVLSDNDGFGEEALLLEGSRTATVKMNSPGRLLVLGKADFDELLRSKMVEEIDAESASRLVRQGEARLLDCRYEMEFEEVRIPGAHLVPLNKLRQEGVYVIDPDQTYVVYCRSGRRSKAAAYLLRERGIRAFSLVGGIKEWPYEVDSTPL